MALIFIWRRGFSASCRGAVKRCS